MSDSLRERFGTRFLKERSHDDDEEQQDQQRRVMSREGVMKIVPQRFRDGNKPGGLVKLPDTKERQLEQDTKKACAKALKNYNSSPGSSNKDDNECRVLLNSLPPLSMLGTTKWVSESPYESSTSTSHSPKETIMTGDDGWLTLAFLLQEEVNCYLDWSNELVDTTPYDEAEALGEDSHFDPTGLQLDTEDLPIHL